jgi:hypothetical protein
MRSERRKRLTSYWSHGKNKIPSSPSTTIPEEVKKKTLEDREKNPILHQFGFKYAYGYAEFDQSNDQIEVGALVSPHGFNRGNIDLNACAGLIKDFRNWLLIYSTTKDDGPLQSVLMWFSHNGGMPINVANDLVKHTVLVIRLDVYSH